MAKIDKKEESELKVKKGHITSISIMRPYRKQGIATKLLKLIHKAINSLYDIKFVTLHTRFSNKAAVNLYLKAFGYEVVKIHKEYYGDGEDAYFMKKDLTK